MKKALYVIASIFEIALLIGAYVIHYFTRRKMGMARYVVYKNQGWESKYPMEILQYLIIALVLLLTIVVLVKCMHLRANLSIKEVMMVVMTILLDILYIGFTFISGTDTLRAYYFIDLMFAIAAVVQVIKTLVSVFGCRASK